MRSALASSLARPEWWAMALATFLLRGGIVVLILPITSLPSEAGVMTSLAPSLEALILGRPSVEGVALIVAVAAALALAIVALLLTASWLDLALVREAAEDDELELGWAPVRGSAWRAVAIRLAAHLPTLVALAWAIVRLVGATYDELLAPGDPALPVFVNVLGRAPDAPVFLVLTWLVGEAAGGLATRRADAGEPARQAIVRSYRQVLGRRGIATILATGVLVVAVLLPFALAAGRAWEHLRAYLLEGVGVIHLGSALVLLVAVWVLGLAVLGAALAWRATAWTAEVRPRLARPADVQVPAPEGAAG